MSGGTGDADMYVKFGSAPTTTVYDCRPYLSGNAETCNIATAQAGTYHVMLRAYATFSGVSLTGSYSTTTVGPYFENANNVNITDNATVESSLAVTGVLALALQKEAALGTMTQLRNGLERGRRARSAVLAAQSRGMRDITHPISASLNPLG